MSIKSFYLQKQIKDFYEKQSAAAKVRSRINISKKAKNQQHFSLIWRKRI